ncbi:MAG: diaminopimelate decarboxylase [Desulfarculaceae bacterium]|jgi:diaminopimelate decarboxylase
MHHFEYKENKLYAEQVSLEEIAREAGTPAYVYSQATLTRHFQAFDQAFAGLDALTCFSVKSNSNQAVLALFASLGGGADIVSGGELARCLAAGVPADRVVFSGVGKTEEEMEFSLKSGILMFNLESSQELQRLNQVAARMGLKAPVSFRVNPDVDAQTHPKITTGMAKNKFGLPVDDAFAQYQEAHQMSHLEVKGVSCHIGSQLTQVSPFADALERLSLLINKLRSAGMEVSNLDLGGGLGITYDDESPPDLQTYAGALKEKVQHLGVKLILEPGRVIVGNAGILLTRVLYTKQTPAKRFLVVDAGMNDLVRPAMYDSYHAIWPVQNPASEEKIVADVVGPICESSDFLARDRGLAQFEPGDLMAVMSAGAYGFTMSSNYNSRPRVPEILVNGDQWAVVRRRETYQDLMQGESLPEWMT